MRILKILVTTLAIGGVAFGGYSLYKKFRQNAEPLASYTTAEVIEKDISVYVTASGTIEAVVTVEVGSQVSGRIQTLYADYNSEVTKGQVIAELEPTLLESQVTQAQANLTAAKASVKISQVSLTEAKRQQKRQKTLRSKGLNTVEELESADSAVEMAQAELSSQKAKQIQAEANLRQAEINLGYATITSPIDGVVIARSVDVGQTVAASLQAPVLFTLAEDLRKMEVHTDVAESDVADVKKGTAVEFTVDAYPDRTFTGVVKEVRYEAKTTQNVVTYDAVVSVENQDLALLPGMTADVRFRTKDAENVLAVPNAALRFRSKDSLSAKKKQRMGPMPGSFLSGNNSGKKPESMPKLPEMPTETLADGQRYLWLQVSPSIQGSAGQAMQPPELKRIVVTTGLTDGSYTEVSGPELKAGLTVVTGESKMKAVQ